MTNVTLRGGSWYSTERNVRCAYRIGVQPYDRYNDGGFRVVAEPEPEPAQVTLRGGSWSSPEYFVRCARRNRYDSPYRSDIAGFRVVLVPWTVNPPVQSVPGD